MFGIFHNSWLKIDNSKADLSHQVVEHSPSSVDSRAMGHPVCEVSGNAEGYPVSSKPTWLCPEQKGLPWHSFLFSMQENTMAEMALRTASPDPVLPLTQPHQTQRQSFCLLIYTLNDKNKVYLLCWEIRALTSREQGVHEAPGPDRASG